MPTKKKRPFIAKNAGQRFLLMTGSETAVNADGETLPNLLVPVASNYKPGTNLFIQKLAQLVRDSNSPTPSTSENSLVQALKNSGEEKDNCPGEDLDLEKILDQFEDASDSNDEDDDLLDTSNVDLKESAFDVNPSNKLSNSDFIVEEDFEDDGEEFDDDLSDFSDDGSELSDTPNLESLSLRPNCPEHLKMLDECIDKKLEEYDDDQLGAVDYEDICGYLDGENKHVDYYIGTSKKFLDEDLKLGNYDQSMKEKILKYSEEEHVEKTIKIVTEKPRVEFDCQSIISTYSNKYNHPALIKEEGKIRKIKIPNNPLQKQLTKSRLKQLDSDSAPFWGINYNQPNKQTDSESEVYSDEDNVSVASTVNIRPKGETPEQRQERKRLFKEMKSENRRLKKENKLAFKHEKKLQVAEKLNLQNNRGIRLF